jgi:hypothetical protein
VSDTAQNREAKATLMAIPEEWLCSNRISLGDVRRHLENATPVDRRKLLEFVHRNVRKIRPQPDADWLFGQMSSYLLDCILHGSVDHRDDHDETVHSPFEAAGELVGWFNWWVRNADPDLNTIRCFVSRMEATFRGGDDGIRNCIETGFLEHIFETPENRQHFAHWANDPVLSDSYTEALRWGLTHSRPEIL